MRHGWLSRLRPGSLATVALAFVIFVPVTDRTALWHGRPVAARGQVSRNIAAAPTPSPASRSPLVISSPTVDWGKIAISPTVTPQARLLVVTNNQSAPLSVTAASLTGPNAAEFSFKRGTSPVRLIPGQSAIFTYAWRPQAVGRRTATLLLTAAGQAFPVRLVGEGVALPRYGETPTDRRGKARPAPQRAHASATSPGGSATGPRDPVGPNVPMPPVERRGLASRVTVRGFTAAAVQAAVTEAARSDRPSVYLPAGTYTLDTPVLVPEGLTLVGEGAQTVVRTVLWNGALFFVKGDQVRLTRMKLVGYRRTWTDPAAGAGNYNASRGIEVWGRQNVRLDHLDIGGFCYGALIMRESSAVIDHCHIHDSLVVGLGYGVALGGGPFVMVADNEFGTCRSQISAGIDVNFPNAPPGAFAFLHNHVSNAVNYSPAQTGVVAVKGPWNGNYLVQGNRFEWSQAATVALGSGSGVVRDNEFRDQGVTFSLYPYGGAAPHDVRLEANVWTGKAPVRRYVIKPGVSALLIDGVRTSG